MLNIFCLGLRECGGRFCALVGPCVILWDLFSRKFVGCWNQEEDKFHLG